MAVLTPYPGSEINTMGWPFFLYTVGLVLAKYAAGFLSSYTINHLRPDKRQSIKPPRHMTSDKTEIRKPGARHDVMMYQAISGLEKQQRSFMSETHTYLHTVQQTLEKEQQGNQALFQQVQALSTNLAAIHGRMEEVVNSLYGKPEAAPPAGERPEPGVC